jgi:putative endonuclease
MFYYVYVLLDKNQNFYIGYTKELEKRLREHKNGLVFATKLKLPITLIYYEACLNKYDATKREKYFKSGPGRKFVKNRLRQYFKGLGPVKTEGSRL